MFSFLNSNNNTNMDLAQGKTLLKYDKITKNEVKPHLALVGMSSSSKLGSIVEALQSDDSTQAKNNINLNNITQLEDKFNRVLVDYSKNYKLMIEELMYNETNTILQKYAGKNVKLAGSSKMFYVNNYGFTHEYSDFSKRPNSCSSEPIEITQEDFNKLPTNWKMPVGMDCGIAGYNIENKTTNENFWVDIRGIHHKYPNNVWENRSESCKSVPLKQVNNSNVVALTPGTPMTEQSMCNRLNIDPKLLKNVETLNKKLISLAKELLIDTEKLTVTDVQQRQQLQKLRSDIQTKIGTLEKDKTNLTTSRYNISNQFSPNLDNIRANSALIVTSNYTRYLIWLILCIGIITLTIYSLISNKQSMVAQGIIVLVALVVLYKILVPIYHKIIGIF